MPDSRELRPRSPVLCRCGPVNAWRVFVRDDVPDLAASNAVLLRCVRCGDLRHLRLRGAFDDADGITPRRLL